MRVYIIVGDGFIGMHIGNAVVGISGLPRLLVGGVVVFVVFLLVCCGDGG